MHFEDHDHSHSHHHVHEIIHEHEHEVEGTRHHQKEDENEDVQGKGKIKHIHLFELCEMAENAISNPKNQLNILKKFSGKVSFLGELLITKNADP